MLPRNPVSWPAVTETAVVCTAQCLDLDPVRDGLKVAKKALAEIWGAEDKQHALAAVKAFEAAHGAKFPNLGSAARTLAVLWTISSISDGE